MMLLGCYGNYMHFTYEKPKGQSDHRVRETECEPRALGSKVLGWTLMPYCPVPGPEWERSMLYK